MRPTQRQTTGVKRCPRGVRASRYLTHPAGVGASRATDNTGELSAMHHALQNARELVRQGERVLIISDSQLAICTTTGAWASRKHKQLVANHRKALARLRADARHDCAIPARTCAHWPCYQRENRRAGARRGTGDAHARRPCIYPSYSEPKRSPSRFTVPD